MPIISRINWLATGQEVGGFGVTPLSFGDKLFLRDQSVVFNPSLVDELKSGKVINVATTEYISSKGNFGVWMGGDGLLDIYRQTMGCCTTSESIALLTGFKHSDYINQGSIIRGVKINRLAIRFPRGDFVHADVDFIAKDRITSALTKTNFYPEVIFHTGDITYTFSKTILECEIMIDNELSEDHFTLDSESLYLTEIIGGQRKITGAIRVFFENWDEFNEMINNTVNSLTISLSKNGYTTKFEIYKFKYTGYAQDLSESPSSIELTLPFIAIKDDSQGTDMKITVSRPAQSDVVFT